MRALAIGCALIIVHASTTASSEPRMTAERAIARGQRLMAKGEYEAALAHFVAAYDDAPYPRTLAQIAVAEQSLERWADAERHFNDVLRGKDDPWVNKNRAVLERCLSAVAAKLGKVVLTSQPPSDAIVRVNGQEFPPTIADAPITVPAGRTTIEVRAPGYRPFVTTIDVAGATMVNLTLALQPLPPPPPPIVEKKLVELPPPPPPPRPLWPKLVGGALVTGGVGSVVAGVVLIRKDGTCAGDPVTAQNGETVCVHIWDTKVAGIALTAVGAASAVAGSVVLWRALRTSAAPTLIVSWSSGPFGSIAGTF